MIRVHLLACALPADQMRSLNRESGRIYTATLVYHYRTYRQAGIASYIVTRFGGQA